MPVTANPISHSAVPEIQTVTGQDRLLVLQSSGGQTLWRRIAANLFATKQSVDSLTSHGTWTPVALAGSITSPYGTWHSVGDRMFVYAHFIAPIPGLSVLRISVPAPPLESGILGLAALSIPLGTFVRHQPPDVTYPNGSIIIANLESQAILATNIEIYGSYRFNPNP